MIKTSMPHKPTRIKIDPRSGRIIEKDENNSTTTPKRHREQEDQTALGLSLAKDPRFGKEVESKANELPRVSSLDSKLDEALNKAIEKATITMIEKNPDILADLIAKKLEDKLKNL